MWSTGAVRYGSFFACLALATPTGINQASAEETPPTSTIFKPGTPECENCGPGEYELKVTDTIPHADYAYHDEPPCGQTTPPIKKIGDAIQTGMEAYAGSYDVKAIASTLANAADALGVGGSVGSFLHQWQPTYSACKLVCGVVPEGAHVTGTKFLMTILYKPSHPGAMEEVNDGGSEPPAPHQDYARIHTVQRSGRAVCSNISNWSGDKSRAIVMKIYFTTEVEPVGGHP